MLLGGERLTTKNNRIPEAVTTVKDPVCGMSVDEKKAAKMGYKGKTYYFCSATCQFAFEKNPKQFAK